MNSSSKCQFSSGVDNNDVLGGLPSFNEIPGDFSKNENQQILEFQKVTVRVLARDYVGRVYSAWANNGHFSAYQQNTNKVITLEGSLKSAQNPDLSCACTLVTRRSTRNTLLF
jgi:hypothetical protein